MSRHTDVSRAMGVARRLARVHRCESGTAMTEAALVMLPLVFFLMLTPAILLIWASEQHARTEAHRDLFDKTASMSQLPRGDMTAFGNPITVPQRRRDYPAFPPEIATLATPLPILNPNKIIPPPDGRTVAGPFFTTIDLFPEGFPNTYVEGWQYRRVRYVGGWKWKGELELMRYGAVARSPWTWLGWPFVPTQDVFFEPQQIQSWYDDNTVDQGLKDALKLID